MSNAIEVIEPRHYAWRVPVSEPYRNRRAHLVEYQYNWTPALCDPQRMINVSAADVAMDETKCEACLRIIAEKILQDEAVID